MLSLFAVFAKDAAEQFGQDDWRIDAATALRLRHHDWPGNVRELRNFATEAVLGIADPVAPQRPTARALPTRVADYEESEIRAALAASKGRVTVALTTLGIPRKTLYDKLKRFGIAPRDYK